MEHTLETMHYIYPIIDRKEEFKTTKIAMNYALEKISNQFEKRKVSEC